jgi:sigma-B regulation protein RsbU (phosphoserine phosphatase)
MQPTNTEQHELKCMEIWSGHRSVESNAVSRGLEAWISSEPFHGDSNGGDVHYFSLCAGGIVTRLVLADVSGHGSEVTETSIALRRLLRRFMNSKSQDRLVAAINREFTALEQYKRFATAVVLTYLSHKRRLLITNAGHPHPLLYRKATEKWCFLSSRSSLDDAEVEEYPSNLPLGIEESTPYNNFALPISEGDRLILYTDAFTEAIDKNEVLLGEVGLLKLVELISPELSCDDFGRALRSAVRDYCSGAPEDDETLIVLKFGKGRTSPGIKERLSGYASILLGEKAVEIATTQK